MPRWAFAFFIIVIIAAVFGFTGTAAGASEIARLCFFFFLRVFMVTLIWSLIAERRVPPPL